MKLDRVIPFSHSLLKKAVQPGNIAIDATLGNGNDTLLLAQLVGEKGHVFGFDIQQQAIDNTKQRLQEHKVLERTTLFLQGHEKVKELVPKEFHGKITGAIFNLGYLPKGDHSIVTTPKTTIEAIEQILEMLAPKGIIVLVIYHGHPGGKTEKEVLMEYVQALDQTKAHVLLYQFINQKNDAPFVVAIEKR